MSITVNAIGPDFAAVLCGVELRCPLEPGDVAEITRLLNRYAVLIFREQPFDDAQQLAFSGTFGRLETAVSALRKDRRRRLTDPRLADVSNLDASGNIRSPEDPWRRMQRANELWHTDSSFKRVAGKISILSAREIPPAGGATEFADLRAAYDALDAGTRGAIASLSAEHCMLYSRSLSGYYDFNDAERVAFPPVARKLVQTHPGSNRTTLYLASHASHIIGWPIERGRALLRELIEFASQPRFVYSHAWRQHDLVIWDNRCTLHRARPYDDVTQRRDMRRTTVSDSDTTQS
jgi:alpha-ketoglutarate-dependent 2,4-dichlorophenoxyacetate dioxygenase